MKSRLLSIFIAVGLLTAVSAVALAEDQVFDASVKSQGKTNVDVSASSEFTSTTSISNSSFDAGDFTIDVLMNNIGWMDVNNSRQDTLHFKTGASSFNLAEKIPNLASFAVANRMAQGSLVGYTFDCNQLGSWDTDTGSWTVDYNTPETKIREGLAEFKSVLTPISPVIVEDETLNYDWCDSYIFLPAGTEFQLGNKMLRFTKRCNLDDITDLTETDGRADTYVSDFARFVYRVHDYSEIAAADSNKNYIYLPKGFEISLCWTRLEAKQDIYITFGSSASAQTDALGKLYNALAGAEKKTGTNEDGKTYVYYTCDADAVFEGGFSVINEILGIMTPGDSKVVVSSEPVEMCSHQDTYVVGKRAATVLRAGYTGDVYCSECDELLSEGETIPKLTATIKLSKTTANIKTCKSTSVTVTYGSGDSIKSLVSSNTNVVTAAKSGSNGIKLTAKKKVGSATVKVTLASGKTANITVKVTTPPCSKITIKSGTSVKIKKGKTHQIKAVISPSNGAEKDTYKTSNKKIATVTSKGKVKGVRKGTAKITIKCGKKSKTIKITVK